ncbi:MAG: MipA/OmpV family protein [Hyphomicrobiales bacterium]|nr:MipA/OmpV family protein [Hyphomicrobiales bacterium]
MGGGAMVKSKHPGADRYLFSPFPIIAVGRFYVPGFGQVVDGNKVKRGFYFYPSFDFNGQRKASDSSDLTGTSKIDWALELGLGAGYRYDWLRGFVELRQGINGHEGQVADFGIDMITNPADRLEVIFGPRASWASDDYMETYFGVTAAEAAAPGSILSAFNADSGFKTVGLEARANYAWSEKTTFHLQGGWDRFVGDAKVSPIVKAGSENQFSIGVGVSYRFAFDVFN